MQAQAAGQQGISRQGNVVLKMNQSSNSEQLSSVGKYLTF